MAKQVSKSTMVNVIHWMSGSNTGMSSKCLATYLCVGVVDNVNYPHDPSDLNRCFQLLIEVPGLKVHLNKMAELGGQWKELIEVWENLEKCFIAEVGVNWCKGGRAPITYNAMKSMGC